MDKKQLLKHGDHLNKFMYVVKVITLVSLVASLILYGMAISSYFDHKTLYAALYATAAFVVFHLTRRYAVSIAKKLLSVRGGYDEVLLFIEEEISGRGRSDQEFFDIVTKAMVVLEKKDLGS